jgi:hypothetical protein
MERCCIKPKSTPSPSKVVTKHFPRLLSPSTTRQTCQSCATYFLPPPPRFSPELPQKTAVAVVALRMGNVLPFSAMPIAMKGANYRSTCRHAVEIVTNITGSIPYVSVETESTIPIASSTPTTIVRTKSATPATKSLNHAQVCQEGTA